jgi:hypothetical protein
MVDDKKKVLLCFAAQPPTTHHVERGVKLGAMTKSTAGKQNKLRAVSSQSIMCPNAFH